MPSLRTSLASTESIGSGAGDDGAGRLLALGNPLRRYLRVLGCAPDRIEDLVQEALLVAMRAGFRWRGEATAMAYLRRTAKNLFLQQIRGERRRREVEIADETWTAWCPDPEPDEYLTALRACVEALPARQRNLLDAAYRDNLGRSGIAARLGLSRAGVKTALRRVRAALRACVERKRGAAS
ncbi:MAG: RNA polymerase sigma factor [Planctomycetes bacterium]|nr:RNA polymerase sigma factor [Planctomycetota bacterium]